MNRRDLESILKEKGYKEGGTKEACIKIREVLNHKINLDNQLHAPGSCVNVDEFIQAVGVLVAFALKQPDTAVTENLYYCENDCAYCGRALCPGEMNVAISKEAKRCCPYYTVEDK